MKMITTYYIEWANGGNAIKGLDLNDAIEKNVHLFPNKMVLGKLIRIKEVGEKSWRYWDTNEFVKVLKKAELKKK